MGRSRTRWGSDWSECYTDYSEVQTCAILAGAHAPDGAITAVGDVRTQISVGDTMELDQPEHRGSAWLGMVFANGEFFQIGWSIDTDTPMDCHVSLPQWFAYIYHPDLAGVNPHEHEWVGSCGSALDGDGFRYFRSYRSGAGDEPGEYRWQLYMGEINLGYAEVGLASGNPLVVTEISTYGSGAPDAMQHEVVARFLPALQVRPSTSGSYGQLELAPYHVAPPCPPGHFGEVVDSGANDVSAGSMGCDLI